MESETREGSRDEGVAAGRPPLAVARTGPAAGVRAQAHPASAHVSRGVAWELKARCAHCRLSVAFEASRHASEDAYILISDCLPGMRPAAARGLRPARNGNAERTSFTRHRDWVLRSPDRSLGSAQRASGGSQVHPAFPPWEAGSHCMARRAQHTRYAPGAQVAAPPVALDQSHVNPRHEMTPEPPLAQFLSCMFS